MMIASFRRLSNSKLGTIVLVGFMVAIVASFALADVQNLGFGSGAQGGGATLAKVGGASVTERDLTDEMQRRLTMIQQQNPEAQMSDIAGDFDPVLASLIDQLALQEFAEENGFVLSKRLIDAEIANLPGTRGLDGKFSEQAYQAFLAQQRLTDAEVRKLIGQQMLQQMLLQPLVVNARVPVGFATPYASMLLEQRQGEVALVPAEAFASGLNPTDADLQRFYAANRNRYTVPEQRVLRFARIGPEQVANVTATEQEIAAEYNRNRQAYGPTSVRVLSQVVAPSQAVANQIAAAAKGNGNLQAAAAGKAGAAFASLGEQSREQFTSLAGAQVAGPVFGAAEGAIVGPVQSDFGWHVVKVEDVREQAGKSLAEARAEIAARLTEEKRRNALADLIDRIEDALAENANFQEAAAAAGLEVSQTPLITASGTSRSDPNFQLPQELAPVVERGFELQQDEDPEVVQIPGTEGNVLVAPARIVPAAPAPLASIRDRVARDWIQQQASVRARAAATQIATKVGRGMPVAQAVREAGGNLPAPRPVSARRIDLSQAQGPVPAPVRMLFSLGEGKSRMVADSASGGFAVVKVNRIVPGNATLQPTLVGRVQQDFEQATAAEYARQFMNAVRRAVGIRRNEESIAEAKVRAIGS